MIIITMPRLSKKVWMILAVLALLIVTGCTVGEGGESNGLSGVGSIYGGEWTDYIFAVEPHGSDKNVNNVFAVHDDVGLYCVIDKELAQKADQLRISHVLANITYNSMNSLSTAESKCGTPPKGMTSYVITNVETQAEAALRHGFGLLNPTGVAGE